VGIIWNPEEMCKKCLKVLERGGGVHMGLVKPKPGLRVDPPKPIFPGDNVKFAVWETDSEGKLVQVTLEGICERKQTLYQVCTSAAQLRLSDSFAGETRGWRRRDIHHLPAALGRRQRHPTCRLGRRTVITCVSTIFAT